MVGNDAQPLTHAAAENPIPIPEGEGQGEREAVPGNFKFSIFNFQFPMCPGCSALAPRSRRVIAALNPQPSTLNPQPSTLNPPPSTVLHRVTASPQAARRPA